MVTFPGAAGALFVRIDAWEAAGSDGTARASVLGRLLPALLAYRHLLSLCCWYHLSTSTQMMSMLLHLNRNNRMKEERLRFRVYEKREL